MWDGATCLSWRQSMEQVSARESQPAVTREKCRASWSPGPLCFVTAALLLTSSRKRLRKLRRVLQRASDAAPSPDILEAIAIVKDSEGSRG